MKVEVKEKMEIDPIVSVILDTLAEAFPPATEEGSLAAVSEFISNLKKTESLISGSFLLWTILKGNHIDPGFKFGDIDVICPEITAEGETAIENYKKIASPDGSRSIEPDDLHLAAIQAFFPGLKITVSGYTYDLSSGPKFRVFNCLVDRSPVGAPKYVFQFIFISDAIFGSDEPLKPQIAFIKNFDFTFLMNYFDGDKVTCVYPQGDILMKIGSVKYGMKVTAERSVRIRHFNRLAKYISRGFRIYQGQEEVTIETADKIYGCTKVKESQKFASYMKSWGVNPGTRIEAFSKK